MLSRNSSLAISIAASALLTACASWGAPRPFSLYGLAGWDRQTFFFHDRTHYGPVIDHQVQVIEAECDSSASGYVWNEKIDLNATPVLAWRWKIESLYPGLNEREKSGDDFPVRVYAVRSGGIAWWNSRAIVYVWSSAGAPEQDWPDPYTDSAHIVVLRAGAEGVGEWQHEQRDLRADFKKYFDLDFDSLDGVAIMTDCDDHKGKTHAWYGDLRLLPAMPPAR